MTDDLLKRATSALREETAQPELRSGLTRARILDDAAKAQKKRGNPLRWLVPFVLTLGAGTALAHVTHQYFPEVWNAVVPAAMERQLPEEAEEVVRRASKPKKKPVEAPIAAPTPAPEPEASVAVVPEPQIAAVEPGPEPKPHRAKRTPAPEIAQSADPEPPVLAVTPKPEAPAPAESAELALFRRAQNLHTAKDPGAIAAWDAFLRVAPKSPLATEARYNRALGLIRAGRSDDARQALAPFARGDMGGYRKREAAELIDALNDRDAGVRER